MFVTCRECGNRRVVYSKAQLITREMAALERFEEELLYVCGYTLFPQDYPLCNSIIVKEGINCKSQIETTYYAGVWQFIYTMLKAKFTFL